MLLVEGISLLPSDSISPHDLDTAENYVCVSIQEVHLVQHITFPVHDCSSLWCYSNFTFHSNNGFLLDLFCGSQDVSVHICGTFAAYMYCSLPILANKYNNSENAHTFINECLAKQHRTKY